MKKLAKVPMRNLLHNHPLLRKGGVHRKTNKSMRRKDKVQMKKEWLPQNMLQKVYFDEATLFITAV